MIFVINILQKFRWLEIFLIKSNIHDVDIASFVYNLNWRRCDIQSQNQINLTVYLMI